MTQVLWSQDIFTKGEISPLMYARVSVSPYYNGLKIAKNVITFPQGAAGKRFGTIYQNTIAGITDASQIYFASMQYLNECIYLIVIVPNAVNIYLEGILVFTITGTIVGANIIRLIDHTILDTAFRIAAGVIAPQDILRGIDSPGNPNTITGFNTLTNIITFTATTVYTAGLILPVRFSTNGTLFTSTPQVLNNKTYFVKFLSPTTAKIYANPVNAKFGLNPFVILGAGTGSQFLSTLNTWTLTPVVFENYPTFDFNEINYSTFVFTPNSISGINNYVDSNTAVFTQANVGGTFSGNGGIMRILLVDGPTQIHGSMIVNFADTSVILGLEASLTEPAWSVPRGYPSVCSSFQNRAFFANSDLLPNGLWGSVINDYNNFDDSELEATNAISWYPTSDDINYIRFIVPYRSLTIHTNSGVFSTPLSVETAITPSNFSLTIQDSTPAEAVQPRGIDNQIIILSGNDAHSLLWDGFNNAYTANIISIANEQLLRNPVAEAAFVDLTRAGSRYMLIVNGDGSLAIYQTLISEEVQGFTPAFLEQPHGKAYFRWVATSYDGRGWFVTERQIATPTTPVEITGFSGEFLVAIGVNLSILIPTAITFTTSGTLPAPGVNSTQIVVGKYYWATGASSDTFVTYPTKEDALAGTNAYTFSSIGTGSSSVVPAPLVTNFMIEELSFNAKTDCGYQYTGMPEHTFTGLPSFEAQEVLINGDGYGFNYTGINATVETIAHGKAVDVIAAQIGFPINVEIQPLPLSIFQGSTKGSGLLTPNHIRGVSFMFADTIGGDVNGTPIALNTFDEVPFGSPPLPSNGIFEYGPMGGWDEYKSIGITVSHSEPFDIKLIGIFYKVDV